MTHLHSHLPKQVMLQGKNSPGYQHFVREPLEEVERTSSSRPFEDEIEYFAGRDWRHWCPHTLCTLERRKSLRRIVTLLLCMGRRCLDPGDKSRSPWQGSSIAREYQGNCSPPCPVEDRGVSFYSIWEGHGLRDMFHELKTYLATHETVWNRKRNCSPMHLLDKQYGTAETQSPGEILAPTNSSMVLPLCSVGLLALED